MIYKDWQCTRWMLNNWFRWKFRRLQLVKVGRLSLLFKKIIDVHPFDVVKMFEGTASAAVLKCRGPESFLVIDRKLYWQTCRVSPRLMTLADVERELAYRAAGTINSIIQENK
jgi:hypothetical protein